MINQYNTKPRSLIFDYLKENANHRFTAKDILEKINESNNHINKTTVYRNLEKLCEDRKLLKFKETDKVAVVYQYSGEHHDCSSHMHAQCSECGKILHLENEVVEEFENSLLNIYGLDVDVSKTILIGKCKDCKNS